MTLAILGAVIAGVNGLLAQWIAYLRAKAADRAVAATARAKV